MRNLSKLFSKTAKQQKQLPNVIVFNSKIALGLIKFQNTEVLHMVVYPTHFSAASSLQDELMETVWTSFRNFWATIYTVCLYIIRADQVSVGKSPQIAQIASTEGLIIVLSGRIPTTPSELEKNENTNYLIYS